MYKAEYIDYAYLVGEGTPEGFEKAVGDALAHKPRGLCVNPIVQDWLASRPQLRKVFFDDLPDAGVLRQFVIDFPLGQGGFERKHESAKRLADAGLTDEFDIVANVGAILSGDYPQFAKEIAPVIELGKPVKVIVETGYYVKDGKDDETMLERTLEWCVQLGVFAIKTSTGFLKNIDNETKRRHVAFWRSFISERGYRIKIKDSGSKRSRDDIDRSLAAGADIVGCSVVIE
ncbi:MAG: hypothetical protein Q8Q39_00660 [bacterium]|nr:hypothetical protein [bacterium]